MSQLEDAIREALAELGVADSRSVAGHLASEALGLAVREFLASDEQIERVMAWLRQWGIEGDIRRMAEVLMLTPTGER